MVRATPGGPRKLAWTAYNGEMLEVRRAKAGTLVKVNAPADLKALVDAARRTSTQMIVSENTGRPYRESDFQHTFAELRSAAGLRDELQHPDFRRTFLTDAGAAGGTDDQLRALSGHKTRNVVSVYVVPDATYANAGMEKLERYRGKKAALAK